MEPDAPEIRSRWRRTCFFIFEPALLVTLLYNKIIPLWYWHVRLGRSGRGRPSRFWSQLFERIYHLDAPRPNPVFGVIFWVAMAGVVIVCLTLPRRDRSLALAGLITVVIAIGFCLPNG
jgi:hypothetical protein